MSRGPSYGPRRTPLPSEKKRERRIARIDRFRAEDERAGVVSTYRVNEPRHPACIAAIRDGATACPRCRTPRYMRVVSFEEDI